MPPFILMKHAWKNTGKCQSTLKAFMLEHSARETDCWKQQQLIFIIEKKQLKKKQKTKQNKQINKQTKTKTNKTKTKTNK